VSNTGVLLAILILACCTVGQSISDDEKRAFDDLKPIAIDVDGDGKSDRIQPRTYQTYKRSKGKRLYLRDVTNWITFDLVTSRGLRVKSFFSYKYGTAENGGSYWVYALFPAGDVNNDGMPDLIFYSGDDTSDETVTLISRGNRFQVASRTVKDADDWMREIAQPSKP